MSAESHRARHISLHHCVDELGTDYLRHHPNQELAAVSYQQVLDWSASQVEVPTEPDYHNGTHHNGATFTTETARERSTPADQAHAADTSESDDDH